ncbi:MAG: type VI secretion system Vgr family protein, partial [Gemmataceae bacterium]
GYQFGMESIDSATKTIRADGQYLITSVRHHVKDAGNYRSGEKLRVEYTNQFTCIPATVPFRPQRTTPRPRIDGVQTAIVVGPPGEEIFTDKYGRIKVHFHWDRSDPMDGSHSPWLRVGTPHAGKGFGGVCIPRVGEEVIISFLEGNPDRPIVMGRVYNEREKPPFALPGKKMISGMKSSTYPGGGGFNEMSMDDTKGQERMFLHAQYNQDTVVGNHRTAKVGVDDFEEVGNNQVVKIALNQTETIGVNQTTTVGQKIVITAGTSITLKCGASMIHMNQAGFITISGTVITAAAAANLAMAAPLVEVAGAVSTMIMGGVTMVEGGVTHIGSRKLTSVTSGGQVDVVAAADLVAKGTTIKLNG